VLTVKKGRPSILNTLLTSKLYFKCSSAIIFNRVYYVRKYNNIMLHVRYNETFYNIRTSRMTLYSITAVHTINRLLLQSTNIILCYSYFTRASFSFSCNCNAAPCPLIFDGTSNGNYPIPISYNHDVYTYYTYV